VAKRKILVVDDEEDCVAYVTGVLESDNTRMLSAKDGVAGLKAVRSQHPDLIILDAQLPKKDGFTVLVELKEDPATRDIPVIMLTVAAEKTGIEFSASAIASFVGVSPEGYVAKPIDADALKAEVNRVLASRS